MYGKIGSKRGIVPRAVQDILSHIDIYEENHSKKKDKVYLRAAIYVIHSEQVYDILSQGARHVKIESYSFVNSDTNEVEVGTRMIGITEKVLLSLEQYYDMVQEGFEQRKILSKKIIEQIC